jgi:hypothetical protein
MKVRQAARFIGHQRGELAQQPAKAVGAGFLLAHQRELVLDEGWVMTVTLRMGLRSLLCFFGSVKQGQSAKKRE